MQPKLKFNLETSRYLLETTIYLRNWLITANIENNVNVDDAKDDICNEENQVLNIEILIPIQQ